MSKMKIEGVEISVDEVARIARMGIEVTYKMKRMHLDRETKVLLDSMMDEAIDFLLPLLESMIRLLAADNGLDLK